MLIVWFVLGCVEVVGGSKMSDVGSSGAIFVSSWCQLFYAAQNNEKTLTPSVWVFQMASRNISKQKSHLFSSRTYWKDETFLEKKPSSCWLWAWCFLNCCPSRFFKLFPFLFFMTSLHLCDYLLISLPPVSGNLIMASLFFFKNASSLNMHFLRS